MQNGALIVVVAFAAEYVDSTLGMGYGTILTPALLLAGFAPLQVVPVVLLSELITGLLAGAAHHAVGNVDLMPKTQRRRKEMDQDGGRIPRDLKVAALLASFSIVGTVAAVLVAIRLSQFWLKLYIGALVLVVGVAVLATRNKVYTFSWSRIGLLGLVASFNKGMSGGGYGPLVTSGQLLVGVNDKSAIGITSLAEGLTCAVGLSAYLLAREAIDWQLAPWLIVGAVLSVPVSAYTVKRVRTGPLRVVVGGTTVLLGAMMLLKLAW